MHICFLSHEYPLWATGGIGSFIQTFGRALVVRGHQVTVVGVGHSSRKEILDDQGVHVVRLPQSTWPKFQFLPNVMKIRRFIKKLDAVHHIDILEASEPGLAFFPLRTPYRKVIRLHGGHHFFSEAENRSINRWKGYQEKRSFGHADGFIAVSEYVKSHTERYLSYHNRPIAVVPLPLDAMLFSPSSTSHEIVAGRLVFAGTVCEKKGIRQLLLSMKWVMQQFPNVKLEVYGRDWYDSSGKSYINNLKKKIDPEILSRVTFHGPVMRSEMPSIYRQAKLCVFPSHMETLGLVAPEAMLTGRPVLFSATGPGPEVITHNETGLLCNPLDERDIADKIIYALSHPIEMEVIAKQGLEFAKRKFDLDRITNQNIEFFERLC